MNRAHVRQRPKNPVGSGGGGGFQPSTLFATGEQGAWFDPSDITTLFQDDAGTVPVTASGQTVGRMLDKSGNNHHAFQATAGSRPTYRTGAGLAWLEFDGVDDYMQTDSINLSTTSKVSVFAGVRKLVDTPTGLLVETTVDGSANNGSFTVSAPTSLGVGAYGFNLRGTAPAAKQATTFTAPITNVLSCAFDIAGADFNTEILPRVNGAAPTTAGSGTGGTGNFSNSAMYIGRRGGATLPFNGNLYGMIARGAASDALTFAGAENYMAVKSGVTL